MVHGLMVCRAVQLPDQARAEPLPCTSLRFLQQGGCARGRVGEAGNLQGARTKLAAKNSFCSSAPALAADHKFLCKRHFEL